MPCEGHFLRPRASSAPLSSSTHLLFASLRPVFLLDQTPPRRPPPATCSTSTPPQHPPLRYNLQDNQHEFHLFVLLCMFFLFFEFHAEFVNYFPFLNNFQGIVLSFVLPFRFPVRGTLCTCISCLLSKIPVWEHWSPTLLLQSSMLSVLYRYSISYVIMYYTGSGCMSCKNTFITLRD